MVRIAKAVLIVVLCLCTVIPVDARATQVVTPDEMHQDLLKSWNQKEQDLSTLQALVSSDAAREVIRQAGSDPVQVLEALPQLSDEELSRLASQARVSQANFAAGLSDRELINVLLIVLLVVAIIVVVAAVAD